MLSISIHAPLAGCDRTRRRPLCPDHRFQSTHPLRGATAHTPPIRRPYYISIHAPLAGCDARRAAAACRLDHFNPRTPCGVRLPGRGAVRARRRFQSTHPLRGATMPAVTEAIGALISIHAPLAGCDARGFGHHEAVHDFNPRTPCGVRPGQE